MPSYVKFVKGIFSKKRKLGEFETLALTEESSAVIQNKFPPKLNDPGSSINFMPIFVYQQLGLGEIKRTSVTLQLADRSFTYIYGILEDVLLKVGSSSELGNNEADEDEEED
ncbi:PREDICTED: uncharacterized protein LOC108661373 [Theobroma cacao]|uniref:Uncharacterized protein LOC108661373 n=1 Tax=Theobroma cacao TaxID=3641 RepID=A0AB32W4T6_THECC|nr:PREDICTED: uncharacterized protein LOC108661373 [Theobroma cacao]